MMSLLPQSIQDNPRLDRWLGLATSGRVTLRSGRVELGQGIHAVLIQIAAEELSLAPECFDLQPLRTAGGPDEGLTAGSRSVEIGGAAVRLAAATLREAALAAAGSLLNVPTGRLRLDEGAILNEAGSTGQTLWSVADRIDWRQEITADVSLKPRGNYRLVGRPLPRHDLAAVFGGDAFIQDLMLPGMLHARVLHSPVPGARLRDAAEGDMLRRFGETCRLLRRNDFLAVMAGSETVARQAAAYLVSRLQWDVPAVDIPDGIGPWLAEMPAQVLRNDPSPATTGQQQFQAVYTRGFLLHGAIGPSCAVALERHGVLRIWTHSQGVFPLRRQIARVLQRPEEEILLEHRRGAGCYGHNGADDAALEAALLAGVVPGRPVRVLWERADEMGATCGSAMAAALAADLDARGRIAGWRMTVSSGTHSSRPGAGGEPNLAAAAACDPVYQSTVASDVAEAAGAGGLRNAVPLYDLHEVSLQHRLLTGLPLRTSSLRGLGAHLNVFAIEGFMDELAEAAGCDPLDFRRRHLADPRARAVLDKAAEMAGWPAGAEADNGRAKGIGLARYKNRSGYCAIVVEVEVAEEVRALKVWCAVDAGLVINPDGARNQIEGGIVQSLSWSLKERVRSENGAISSRDWDSYPILRFSELPQIETYLFEQTETDPLGVGEVAQGPAAAALGNAASRALGARLRDLPLSRDRVMAALLQ